jgi:RimJ/RimL family protein N-acetyltransferase
MMSSRPNYSHQKLGCFSGARFSVMGYRNVLGAKGAIGPLAAIGGQERSLLPGHTHYNISIWVTTDMEEEVLEIRPLAAPDAAAFSRIRFQAISDSPSAVWPTYEEEAKRTVEEIEARIQRTDTQVVFGAFIDTKLVGIAGLRREPLNQVKHKAVLWGVFVSPDRRREGLARKLFARVMSFARDEGVLQIQLCVNAENVRARSLYRSLGFKPFGLEPRAMRVGNLYFDEEHMVLRLDD